MKSEPIRVLERLDKPKPMADEMARFFAHGTDRENWTDEQWAEHDRLIAAQDAALREQVRQNEIAARRRALQARGFSLRAIDALDAVDMTASGMAQIVQWHAANPKEGIAVLSGQAGCGKTVAATWWALEVNATSVRASTLASSSRYDRETRDDWLNAHALVLDDLGAEYADAKGSFLVDLDELIDVKYGNRQRMVITTNCTADEFKTRYGQRIVDRLRECGTWLSIAGGSLRRKP